MAQVNETKNRLRELKKNNAPELIITVQKYIDLWMKQMGVHITNTVIFYILQEVPLKWIPTLVRIHGEAIKRHSK